MKTRSHFLVLLALVTLAPLRAQTFTQVRDSGPRATRLNIAFLAEGYTAAEQTKFQGDAATLLQVLLSDESWSRFASYINAFTIYVASNQSGADDPSTGTLRDTYFNSTFGTNGIDRLLTIPSGPDGTGKVLALLTQYLPDYDLILILVNSTKYGGAGGGYLTTSLNVNAREIMLHELGHTFAKLTDEYVDTAAAPFYAPAEYPNATQKNLRETSPWRDFIAFNTAIPTASAPDENTVGLFTGSEYRASGFYRPTYDSKMRELGRPFGPVNLRAYATALHALNLEAATTKPVPTQSPAGGIVAAGQSRTLQVAATGAGPMTYLWRFNGVYIPTALGTSLTIPSMSAASAGGYSVEVTNAAGTTTVDLALTLTGSFVSPGVSVSPSSVMAGAEQSVTLSVLASGTPPFAYEWRRNGVAIAGATAPSLTLAKLAPADAGIYFAALNGTQATSAAAIVGVLTTNKLVGAAHEVRSDIEHPVNHNIYDQLLLDGAATTFTADAGQITRISFVDLSNDIVQVEFSGAGALSLTLDNATGPAAPVNYIQPGVLYMKGHASIVIVGANETTNLTVFSVGRGNAVDQSLFRSDVDYDGVADIASISIASSNGKFGSIHAGDVTCVNDRGFAGLYAPGVQFGGPVYLGNISASDSATPVLVLGSVSDLRITGGDLLQPNGRAVQAEGFAHLQLTAGTDSHNRTQPKEPLRARFEKSGADVTPQITVE